MTQNVAGARVSFSSYQKLIVLLLALLQFTVVLDFMVLSPLGDMLIKSMSITPSMFGAVVSSYAFSAGVSGILAAGFADRFDRKKLLLFFYSGFILGTLGCALANTYYLLLAARIVTGLFGGVISAIGMAIIADLFAIHQRGRVIGMVQISFAASQVLGIPAGIYLANLWDWHAPFFIIVCVAAVIFAAILLKVKPIDAHLQHGQPHNAFRHLLKTVAKRNYRAGFLATAVLSLGGFMLMPFSSAFMVNNVGMAPGQLPLIFLFTGISSIVVMPAVGKLSDRVPKLSLFTYGSVLAIIMILIYTNLMPVPLWQVVLVNVFLFMGIMSRMIPGTALTTAIPDMQDRGAFMSVNASLQQLAGGIASLVAGLIVAQETPASPILHYDTLGYLVCATIAICLFLYYRVNILVQKKTTAEKLRTVAPLTAGSEV